MTGIHVRNVPEPTLAALRERASAQGRSMQQELLEILRAAAAQSQVIQHPEPIRLVTAHTGGDARWNREEIYDDQGR